MKKAIAIILGVLFLDQFVKIWIKTHMYLGESYRVTGEWFYLHFVENPGMAFGLQLGGDYGKLMLSVFRIIAVAGIGYYMWTLTKRKVRPLLIVCVALIFAGALGNIIDSVFYGVVFNASDAWDQNVAQFMPAEGGYAGWLHGQVVDMFYFPVMEGTFPDNFPIWGGEDFLFFRPVFNLADASISAGIFLLIVFQTRLFAEQHVVSDRKVLVTNIFFAVVIFLFSLFLLLTLSALFSATHPVAVGYRIGILIVSLGLAGVSFYFLQRMPRFIPEAEAESETEKPVTEQSQDQGEQPM